MPRVSNGGISLLYLRIYLCNYKIYLVYLAFYIDISSSLYMDRIYIPTYIYRSYFWNHQVVNAMESPSRMPFVKGLVAIKGHFRLPRLPWTLSQTCRYMHLRPLHWQVSPGTVTLKHSKTEVIYIKLYGTISFCKLLKSTCNNLLWTNNILTWMYRFQL